MSHETVQVRTEDGTCPVHVFSHGEGKQPAVVMYMDAFGVRPAMYEIADRLAESGYCVLLPDLYYRNGWTAKDLEGLFSSPEKREFFMKTVLPTVGPTNMMRDLSAILGYIDRRPGIDAQKVGTTGYCMGGRISITAAGTFPDRISAAASYHAGGLATDAPDSPHKLAPQMKARVYVAGAIEDPSFDDAQKQRFDDALTAAKVEHTVETYNALHGFVPSDTPVHDEAATERHWKTMLGLFDSTLKS